MLPAVSKVMDEGSYPSLPKLWSVVKLHAPPPALGGFN
jgi:hypothetical protein